MFINSIKYSLLNLPRAVKRSLVAISDILICGLSTWFAFGLLLDEWGFFRLSQWCVLIVNIGFLFPLFIAFGLYRTIFRYIGLSAFVSIVRVFIIYTCLFFTVFTLIGIDRVPRSIGIIQPILLFICIGAHRYFIRIWLGDINNEQEFFSQKRPSVLVYGAGDAGRQLVSAMALDKKMLLQGFIDDDKFLQGNTINGLPVYGCDNIKSVLSRLKITDVLLAIPSVNQARRSEIITFLSSYGVRVRSLPGIMDLATGRASIADLYELDVNDLLGRTVIPPNIALLEKNVRGKTVLVTGAGGSIGSELCRQIIEYSPSALILVENNEYALYLIEAELNKLITGHEESRSELFEDDGVRPISTKALPIKIIACLASVQDKDVMLKIFNSYLPDLVFHGAAFKHVSLVEKNPFEGTKNNVMGTLNCAQVSLETGVSYFVLVSTDKAVRPTNVMGASKRIAEMILQALAQKAEGNNSKTKFLMVRFGNVLGSSGSVVPLFRAQIKAGGPITLTHPEATRFFMTIPEAAQLVIQSSAMAKGGEVFVLDMNQPVRIYDLAVKMVHLSGHTVKDELHPHGDIEIKLTGLQPGEKLYEELLIGNNPQLTDHPKIMKANEEFLPWDDLELELEQLNLALHVGDVELLFSCLRRLVPSYMGNDKGLPYLI